MKQYSYLDIVGIESLYSQACGILQTSCETTSQETSSKETSWHSFLSLSKFLAIVGAGVDATKDFSKATSIITHTDEELTSENQLKIVLEALDSAGALIRNLQTAVNEVHDNRESRFVLIAEDFRLLPLPNAWHDPIDEINATQHIQLEAATQYFVNEQTCQIRMNGRLYKWLRHRECQECSFSPASHLAIQFKESGRFGVHMQVFGNLSGRGNKYYIKPFSIST